MEKLQAVFFLLFDIFHPKVAVTQRPLSLRVTSSYHIQCVSEGTLGQQVLVSGCPPVVEGGTAVCERSVLARWHCLTWTCAAGEGEFHVNQLKPRPSLCESPALPMGASKL